MNRRHHPVWNDAQGPTTQGVGGAALTAVSLRGTLAKIESFSANGTDSVTFYCQMPHGWDGKTVVRPHIHYVPLVTPAADRIVLWEGRYAWSSPGEVIPSDAAWTTFSHQTPVLTTDGFKQLIQSLAEITPPASAGPSSFLIVYLSRNGASATDTYTDGAPSNLGVLGVDVHYIVSRHGSLDEFGDQLA